MAEVLAGNIEFLSSFQLVRLAKGLNYFVGV